MLEVCLAIITGALVLLTLLQIYDRARYWYSNRYSTPVIVRRAGLAGLSQVDWIVVLYLGALLAVFVHRYAEQQGWLD